MSDLENILNSEKQDTATRLFDEFMKNLEKVEENHKEKAICGRVY